MYFFIIVVWNLRNNLSHAHNLEHKSGFLIICKHHYSYLTRNKCMMTKDMVRPLHADMHKI